MGYRYRRRGYTARLPDDDTPLASRRLLAVGGLLVCVAGAVVAFVVGVWTLGLLLIALAVIAVVNIAVISHRKRRGPPG